LKKKQYRQSFVSLDISQTKLLPPSFSHLQGILNRTVLLLEKGIKPIWVFDGKPPALKEGEIAERKKAKEEATKKLEEAKEEGDIEEAKKALSRTARVSPEMTADAKKLVELLGVPMIEAETEAEAQCATIVKAGKAWATVSEDMDTLTFGSSYLLRNLNAKKDPILEICLEDVLSGFDLNHEEFINLCILCGCDYLKNLEGIGPVTAFKLIQEHKDIEGVLKKLKQENEDPKKKKKYNIPENYDLYKTVRDFFREPEVKDPETLEFKWRTVDEEALKEFLCNDKNFREVNVDNACNRVKKSASKVSQKRLDNFFTVKRKEPSFSRDKTPDAKKGKGRGSGGKNPFRGKK